MEMLYSWSLVDSPHKGLVMQSFDVNDVLFDISLFNCFTHWPLGDLRKIFLMLVSNVMCHVFSWNLFFDAYQEYLVNIASGYGLLPDVTKP